MERDREFSIMKSSMPRKPKDAYSFKAAQVISSEQVKIQKKKKTLNQCTFDTSYRNNCSSDLTNKNAGVFRQSVHQGYLTTPEVQ